MRSKEEILEGDYYLESQEGGFTRLRPPTDHERLLEVLLDIRDALTKPQRRWPGAQETAEIARLLRETWDRSLHRDEGEKANL